MSAQTFRTVQDRRLSCTLRAYVTFYRPKGGLLPQSPGTDPKVVPSPQSPGTDPKVVLLLLHRAGPKGVASFLHQRPVQDPGVYYPTETRAGPRSVLTRSWTQDRTQECTNPLLDPGKRRTPATFIPWEASRFRFTFYTAFRRGFDENDVLAILRIEVRIGQKNQRWGMKPPRGSKKDLDSILFGVQTRPHLLLFQPRGWRRTAFGL